MKLRTGALFLLLATTLPAQQLHLDPSGAFFTVDNDAREPAEETIVAATKAGPITSRMFARFAGERRTPRMLENLAFALALARECERQQVARSAPTLARSAAARQFVGQTAPDARTRARLATESLRDLRIAALVGSRRAADPAALQELFEHRYGRDGVRVRVRHILSTDEMSAPQTAAQRAEDLFQRLGRGQPFDELLQLSHDRLTRRLLRDPKLRDDAGVLPNYNYHRYGFAFAAAVRDLEVGAVSPPVGSPVGVHLIQLLERTVTRLADVAPALRRQLASGKARSSEVLRLRSELLTEYGFRQAGVARPPATAADAAPPPAADWPHYRGNAQLAGVAGGHVGDQPELAWTFETGGEILSSPVVADGTVYVGSTDNSVYAIDLATGARRWAYATADMVEAPPLVLDDRVYVGSSDFFLYALDAATGRLAWRFETGDRILGGANWFRSRDGENRIVVGSYDARVYCLDADDGRQRWSYETDNYVHGSPAIANGEVVFGGCDAALHLVDTETGQAIAKVEIGEGCQIAGSVALAGDKAYFGHYGNEFLRVDLSSGDVDWRYAGNRQGFCSSPALDERYVVFGGRDKQLHCVLRADGSPRWTFKTRRKVDASPVISGDKVVFGSGDGRLYLLRLDDGKQLWSYDIGRPIYSSPAVVEGMILVGAGDKRLYAFRAPPGPKK